jgi:uncharacterized protein
LTSGAEKKQGASHGPIRLPDRSSHGFYLHSFQPTRRSAQKFQEFAVPAQVQAAIAPLVLLTLSNIFMTFAWYGHLKFKASPLWLVIVASWGIAFFEYCLAVPANRIGHQVYSAAELKTIQEVITLAVFALFSIVVLKEPLTINHFAGFALIVAGAFIVFKAPL